MYFYNTSTFWFRLIYLHSHAQAVKKETSKKSLSKETESCPTNDNVEALDEILKQQQKEIVTTNKPSQNDKKKKETDAINLVPVRIKLYNTPILLFKPH